MLSERATVVVHRSRPIMLGGLLGGLALAFSWIWIGEDQFWKSDTSVSERLETVTKSYSSLLIVFGLGFAYRRLQVADRQARTAEEGQLTQRFGSAIEQLASEALSVRIGGLYSLERLGRDFSSFHSPTVEILSAFIKDRSAAFQSKNARNEGGQIKLVEEPSTESPSGRAPARTPLDIQVAMKILGRRDSNKDAQGQRLDLEGAHLRGIRLTSASFADANLSEAELSGASFRDCDLSGADLVSATMIEVEFRNSNLTKVDASWAKMAACNLEKSDLRGAEFQNADLNSCGLNQVMATGASFRNAKVHFSDFTGAELSDATFEGVDCSNTAGLSREQLNSLGTRPSIEPVSQEDR